MKRARPITAAAVALALAAVAVTATSAHAVGTTYYIDAASGSDSAAGTSPSAAWSSLAKVNSTTFAPGDSILFHGGQVWAGSLHPSGSGSATAPITLGAYGTGMPRIDAGGIASGGAISLANQSYWTITGFELTNDSGSDNVGGATSTSGGAVRDGVLVQADNQKQSGITITGNFIHDVNGCFTCSAYDAHFNGGIVVVADVSNAIGLAGGGYTDTVISNNVVNDVGRTGIIFGDNSAGTPVAPVENLYSQNVTITGNSLTHIASDGIIATGASQVLIDHNTVQDGGLVTVAGSTEPSAAGIWPARTDGVTVQYNEVSGMRTQQDVDGQGFDVDLYARNTVVQYNYSHDNEGGFLLMEGGTPRNSLNLTARYNLSVNDAWGGSKGVFTFGYGVIPSTSIYNNTVYVAPALPSRLIVADGGDHHVDTVWNFTDNIIANYGSGDYDPPYGAGTSYDHNLFAGNHPATEPADAEKLQADPQFIAPTDTAPSGIASVTGFQVTATSPAVGSGAAVMANGGHDYFGRGLSSSSPPTRGFFEAQTF